MSLFPSLSRLLSLAALVLIFAGGVALGAPAAAPRPNPQTASQVSAKAALAADYGKLPLSFEANQGQVDSQVRFTSRGSGYSLFLTDKEAVLSLSRKSGQRASEPASQLLPLTAKGSPAKDALKTDVVRMQLAGASAGLKVEGEEKLPGVANYFIGNDRSKWHAGVPTYSKVKYAGVYPGIDLVYYGNQRQLEYDFVVAPGADPKQVRLHFAGAEKLKLNSDGDLVVVAKNGEIAFHKPVVYQVKDGQLTRGQLEAGQPAGESAGQRELVEGKFSLLAKNVVGFTLGSYDRSRAVVIDPTLVYSTYLGGSIQDLAYAIAVDSAGSAYVTGGAFSQDFPVTPGAFQLTNQEGYSWSAAFVTKLNPSGTGLVYSTYLGGSGNYCCGDVGLGIAVDSAGDAYISGSTTAPDFPVTAGAFQTVNHGYPNGFSNAFITKLNSSGSALVYSTYLGGRRGSFYGDSGYAIAVDAAGEAYVAGLAYSSDFPTTARVFQSSSPSVLPSAFVTKINQTGTALVYSTYLGGNRGQGGMAPSYLYGGGAQGVAVDASGDAYVTGYTTTTDFPVTASAFQKTNKNTQNGTTGFVSKLNPTGSALVYSTYLGGSGGTSFDLTESGNAIALDALGDAYVTGATISPDFPKTANAFQTSGTIFVTKLNPTGSELVYSTGLGGSGSGYYAADVGAGIAVDASGDAYVTGKTCSVNFPVTPDAFQKTNEDTNGNSKAFVTELNSAGTGLVYSTYLGGTSSVASGQGGDGGYGIAVDGVGDIYIAGIAASDNFPTTAGAFQGFNKSMGQGQYGPNAFIANFSPLSSVINFDKGFAGASGLQLNGSATISGSRLRLTDGGKFEAASAFFETPVSVQSFVTDFTFQLTDPSADGLTFTLQNNSPSVLGDFGGALGYAPIGASVAIKFDLHNNAGEGINSTGLYLSGAEPTYPGNIDLTGTGIDLHSGHIFNGYLSYDGTNLILTINDLQTKAAFTRFLPINIPSVVGGNTAYAGFTAGTGAETATQEILSWGYVPGH
jgi:hypothetical protein